MGTITRSLANNITTGGVILPAGITNSSVIAVTSFANAPAGTLVLISTQTASNSASLSFTSGLDSTYDAYEFKFIDIHARTDDTDFQFNLSSDGGANYNVTKTTTYFRAYHNEADTVTGLAYYAAADLAQGTGYQYLPDQLGADADQNMVGSLQLFNPSSTTYVKHFISSFSNAQSQDYNYTQFIAGYANTTSAINAITFRINGANFDGTIKMYGVKKS
jgi:hypothetical protein